MEKIFYVKEAELNEINTKLKEGWKLTGLYPIQYLTSSSISLGHFGAYMVLEKSEQPKSENNDARKFINL